ncbi:MAG: hypothetical protein ACI9OJ_001415 [Myxococcota bacterium]
MNVHPGKALIDLLQLAKPMFANGKPEGYVLAALEETASSLIVVRET